MGAPATATAATTKARKVLVKAITGPIRAIGAVGGNKITFNVLECTVDGKSSNGSDLTTDEAKQIKWVIKEATSKKSGDSYKLVVGRELATGIGKTLEYTIPTGMIGNAIVAMAYVNSPSAEIAQWVKISDKLNFLPSRTTHIALTETFPVIRETDKLNPVFKAQWDAFAKALEDAKAKVDIQSTLRSLGRAYMMHYCALVANGRIKPWEVPDGISSLGEDTGPVGVEWSHTQADGRVDLAKSKRAANDMKVLFRLAHPASLTSNHVLGKAVDVSIEWSGTIKIAEKGSMKEGKAVAGKEHEIKTAPRHGGTITEPAGNKELRDVAATYGVKKMLTDAPHWSVDGR